MIHFLSNNPLLLLFVVAALGYPLGRIRIFGIRLGVASVLFTGLFFGALDSSLRLPDVVYMLGLGLFVYTIGLSGGASFVASLRHHGIKYNLLVLALLGAFALLALLVADLAAMKGTILAGLYAGAFTNTPALACAIESIRHIAPANLLETLSAEPVVAYSVAYPMGVLGMVLSIALCQRLWKVDYAAEAKSLHVMGIGETLVNRTVAVEREDLGGRIVAELTREHDWDVMFGRIRRDGHYLLAGHSAVLRKGDLVTVVGGGEDVERVTRFLGRESGVQIDLDRSEFDFRRIFVSNPAVAGKTVEELNLPERFGAMVTRIRRGDDDFIPHDELPLELGDRVRVLAHRGRMGEVSAFFGDSYRGVSEVDVLTFSLGLAVGLALGSIRLPLPGGASFSLGFAGGPLIVALVLGTLGRTGPLVWSIPYSASLTLRQFGLVLFLAGIGTRAGSGFLAMITSGGGILIFLAGALLTIVAAFATLWIGHRVMKIPMNIMTGILAGMQTQPALLAYALEQAKNDLPNVGYTSVYPVATIAKILLVQLLLTLGTR